MFYRENGQFKTNYRDDQQIFPIAQDRWAIILLVLNIIISFQENKVEWFRLISNVLLIILFSMNICSNVFGCSY